MGTMGGENMIQIICDFCKQPLSNALAHFRHNVQTSNFMIGKLPNGEEMCDICYTRAKNNPPSKEEYNDYHVNNNLIP